MANYLYFSLFDGNCIFVVFILKFNRAYSVDVVVHLMTLARAVIFHRIVSCQTTKSKLTRVNPGFV